ncbi:MAG: cupin domain-containing protein [bacterium]
MSPNNIFYNLPDAKKNEIFEEIVSNEKILVERITSLGQKSPADFWFDQGKDELVFLLSGEAEISFENGTKTRLVPGDYLLIPAHKKHRVEWTDEHRETIWLAIHY